MPEAEYTTVHGNFTKSLDNAIQTAKKMGVPPYKLVGELEAVFAEAYLDTQDKTHIITGSLKASGKKATDFDGNDWEGTISYGGSSGGPNNPVDYAIYEMARGGDHDFFRDLGVYEQQMHAVILKYQWGGD